MKNKILSLFLILALIPALFCCTADSADEPAPVPPSEPAGSADVTEPAPPSEPVGSADVTEPASPSEPAGSADVTEPAPPSEPVGSADVTEPAFPSGYTPVEFIASHGWEYIDTGVTPTKSMRAEIDYQFTNISPGTYAGAFGAYEANNRFSVMVNSSGKESVSLGAGYYQQDADLTRRTAVLDNAAVGVSFNGKAKSATSGSFSRSLPKKTLLIFAYRTADETRCSACRIYGVRLFEANQLVHDFVPCRCDATGEYGLYDLTASAFFGNASGGGLLTGSDVSEECTVTLTAPDVVSVAAYAGFADDKTECRPVSSASAAGITSYTYSLPVGEYHFLASGTGYHTLHKNFIVSVQDLLAGQKTLSADPGEKTLGGSYQSKVKLYSYSDELLQSPLMNIDGLLAQYPDLLDTPAFSDGKGREEYTTQAELEAFIGGLDDADDAMYVYTIGQTARGKTMYLTVHSLLDLSGMGLAEAGAAMQTDSRPTVFIESQIHGNEPGGGEGALALMHQLDGAYGEEVLKTVNVVIVPRVNGDGAEDGVRYNSTGADMNRDHMRVQFQEVRNLHEAYNLFMPEVVITAHEQNANSYVQQSAGTVTDLTIGSNPNRTQTDAFNELNKAVMSHVVKSSSAEGFRVAQYGGSGYRGPVPSSDTSYFRMRGSLCMLTESTGIAAGKALFRRRVASQFDAFKNLIAFVSENAEKVVSVVAAERQAAVDKGATFEESDLIVLKHGTLSVAERFPLPTYYTADGSVKNADATGTLSFCETPEVTRPRPTAYAVPADAKNISTVLATAESHGIRYYAISAGESAYLRQYGGTITEAVPAERQKITFSAGAYVFPMDQVSGTLLSTLMEPDFHDEYGDRATFVQLSLLDISEVYRCEDDLIDGRIPLAD